MAERPGILNMGPYANWNPETDPYIQRHAPGQKTEPAFPWAKAAPEMGVTMATGLLSMIPAGYAGMTVGGMRPENRPLGIRMPDGKWYPSLVGNEPATPADMVQHVMENATTVPQSQVAQEGMRRMGESLSPLMEDFTKVGDWMVEKGVQAGMPASMIGAGMAGLLSAAEVVPIGRGPAAAQTAARAAPRMDLDRLASTAMLAQKYDPNVTRAAQALQAGAPIPEANPALVNRSSGPGLLAPDDEIQALMDAEVGSARRMRDVPANDPMFPSLLGQTGRGAGQRGGPAWHGSRAKFNLPDNAFMGTGEGFQAYGWGHYVAERPGVARWYRDALTDAVDDMDWNLVQEIVEYNVAEGLFGPGSKESVRNELLQLADDYKTGAFNDDVPRPQMEAFLRDAAEDDKFLEALSERGKYLLNPELPNTGKFDKEFGRVLSKHAEKGNLYEYDIPDAEIEKMLDWDKPLSEQPAVKKAFDEVWSSMDENDRGYALLDRFGDYETADRLINDPGDITGKTAYKIMAHHMGSDQAASLALNDAGIPGIRYLDRMSRGGGQGTRNMVLFDPKATIKGIKRNGEDITAQSGLLNASGTTKAKEDWTVDDWREAGFWDGKTAASGDSMMEAPPIGNKAERAYWEGVYQGADDIGNTQTRMSAQRQLNYLDEPIEGEVVPGGLLQSPAGGDEWFRGSRHHGKWNPDSDMQFFSSDALTAGRFGPVEAYQIQNGKFFNPDNPADAALLREAFSSDEALEDFAKQYDEIYKRQAPDIGHEVSDKDAREMWLGAGDYPVRDYFDEGLDQGNYQVMESPAVVKWLRDNGYDGTMLREDDFGSMGLAVFDTAKDKPVRPGLLGDPKQRGSVKDTGGGKEVGKTLAAREMLTAPAGFSEDTKSVINYINQNRDIVGDDYLPLMSELEDRMYDLEENIGTKQAQKEADWLRENIYRDLEDISTQSIQKARDDFGLLGPVRGRDELAERMGEAWREPMKDVTPRQGLLADPAGERTFYHGGTGAEADQVNVPGFFTTEREGAKWFADDRGGSVGEYTLNVNKPLYLDSREGSKELIDIAREAGIDVEVNGDILKGTWDFYAPEISKHSPYDGTNLPDLLYIPAVRDALAKRGYDGVQLDDLFMNGSIETMVTIDPAQATKRSGILAGGPQATLPEKLYHGSYAGPFDEFEGGRVGAVFTSSNPEYSRLYGPNFGEVIVDSKNPADLVNDQALRQKVIEEFNSGGGWGDRVNEFDPGGDPLYIEGRDSMMDIIDAPDNEINEMLADMGYDSIMFREGNNPEDITVVAMPEQVKWKRPGILADDRITPEADVLPFAGPGGKQGGAVRDTGAGKTVLGNVAAREGILNVARTGKETPVSTGVGVRSGLFDISGPGSGARGQVTKYDAARTLEHLHGNVLGRQVADPTTTRGMNNMIARGADDVGFQLEQPVTGQGWYDEDIGKTFGLLESNFNPRYADPDIQTLWTGVAAPTSYGTPVPSNARVATNIMQHYLDSGRIPSMNPETGKLWTMRPTSKEGLELTQFLLDRFGPEGYSEFMLTPHSIRDLAQLRKESGVFKGDRPLTSYKNIAGNLDDARYGAYILGEKGGPFMLNLNGIKDTTVDLWQMRNYGRSQGRILHPKTGELIDAPISPAMRNQAKQYTRGVADRFGLSEQDTQAIQWYFEQQLYDQMGVSGAVPRSFSEGVESLMRQQGILQQ